MLIWSLFSDPRRSRTAIDLIEASRILVSVATIYDIDFKRRDPARRRAQDALLLRMPADMPHSLPKLGLELLPIDAEVASTAANLPIDHGDPWDRILLAQALVLRVPLLTADHPLSRAAETHPMTRGITAS